MREPAEHETALVSAARSALLETTPEETVGDLIGVDEPAEGVVDVLFSTEMPGYPGWSWTVSVSVADGAENPSVLELSLLPGDEALVAPEWVPWSDRLADYRAAQEAKDGALDGEPVEDDELVEEDDLLDDDADELDGVDFEDAVLEDEDEDDAESDGDEDEGDEDLDDRDVHDMVDEEDFDDEDEPDR